MAKRTHRSKSSARSTQGIICTGGEIEKYHDKLSNEMSQALDDLFIIRSALSGGSWRDAAGEENAPVVVPFSIVRGAATQVGGRSQPDFVMKIPTGADPTLLTWWIGWREEWDSVGGGNFAFRSTSIKFFCGGTHAAGPDELVFRAEWGPFELGRVGGNAAHPHWHAHRDVEAEVIQAEGDVTTTKRLWMTVRGFHLPMGGWTHGEDEPTRCWQVDQIISKPDDFRIWAIRTLRYFQTQLQCVKQVKQEQGV